MHTRIETLDIETINSCNASCPQCLRTNEINPDSSLYNDVLDFDKVLENVNPTFWQGLKQIVFNGNTGDNIAHPNIRAIILEVSKLAPQAQISLSTNGGLRNQQWWSEFGHMMLGSNFSVTFGIDGLEDTHALYRVGTSWKKIIKNAQAFIDAGGIAYWQMIPFLHNQHQIEDCRTLSKDLGFKKFFLKRENRFPANQTSQPVFFQRKMTHTIQAPNNVEKFMSAADHDLDINTSMQNMNINSKIQCKSIETNWMAIYADGTVWPCCFLMGWHKSPHQTNHFNVINYHFNKILKLDLSQMNLYTNRLEDILSNEIWQKHYESSFNNMPNPVCIQQCSTKP